VYPCPIRSAVVPTEEPAATSTSRTRFISPEEKGKSMRGVQHIHFDAPPRRALLHSLLYDIIFHSLSTKATIQKPYKHADYERRKTKKQYHCIQ